MTTPTLINLPPPPSDPATPSDVPGTPNSTTTSMSELSTVAIKDGHRGHPHHHSHKMLQPTSHGHTDTLEAERADRISRLAGLERVATTRQTSNTSLPAGASASTPQGYFDAPIMPTGKERSTVGSASATGSVGGRTTWASGSDGHDPDHDPDQTDKMSEDLDTSSTGGFSEEGNASLVGFGEGASSTVSGPVSAAPVSKTPQRQSATIPGTLQPKAGGVAPYKSVTEQKRDARMIDGLTYDPPMPPGAGRPPPGQSWGPSEGTERSLRGSFDSEDVPMANYSERDQRPPSYGEGQ